MDPPKYNQLLTDDSITGTIYNKTKDIADKLNISDCVTTLAKKDAFITLNNHKTNFENNPKCHLINPAKSELGRVSKTFLDKINTKVHLLTNANQWKNTCSVIEWFKNLNNKHLLTFLSFDIVDFYPSITENLLTKSTYLGQ